MNRGIQNEQPGAAAERPSARLNLFIAFAACALGAVVGLLWNAPGGREVARPIAVAPIPPPASSEQLPEKAGERADLKWSALESADLARYRENLRAAGFPEEVIADIIRGQVVAFYQAKINAIFDPLAKYWSSTDELKRQDERIKALRGERDKLLADLGLLETVGPADNGLPPEKQRYVSEALRQYPKTDLPPDATPEQRAQAAEGRKARLAYLSQFLTPDELLTYRIAMDSATNIGHLMRDINLSEEEFRNVFSALDGEQLGRNNGLLRPDLESKLRQALGEDRYADYQRAMAPENAIFSDFAHMFRLNDDQIARLQELRRSDAVGMEDYRKAVAGILQNPLAERRYFQDTFLFDGGPKLRRRPQ